MPETKKFIKKFVVTNTITHIELTMDDMEDMLARQLKRFIPENATVTFDWNIDQWVSLTIQIKTTTRTDEE